MFARKAHDGAVEGSAKTAFGRADHEKVDLVATVSREKLGRLGSGADPACEVGQNLLHALGERPRGFGRHLGAA